MVTKFNANELEINIQHRDDKFLSFSCNCTHHLDIMHCSENGACDPVLDGPGEMSLVDNCKDVIRPMNAVGDETSVLHDEDMILRARVSIT